MATRRESAGSLLVTASGDDVGNGARGRGRRKARPNRRTSVGSRLARKSLASSSNGEKPGTSRVRGAAVVFSEVERAKKLSIVYANGGDPLDVSYFLDLSEIGLDFAEGMRLWTMQLGVRSRYQQTAPMRDGLVGYLRSRNAGCTWDDLPALIEDGFGKYLKQLMQSNKLSASTMDDRIGAASRMFDSLAGDPRFRVRAIQCKASLPPSFSRSGDDSVPRLALPISELNKIWAAVFDELIALKARFEEGERRIARGLELLKQGSTDYADFDVVLAALASRYFLLPDYGRLKSEFREIYYFVYPGKYRSAGLLKFASFLYASPRDLVPFMLLMAIELFGNAESIIRLKWSEIKPVTYVNEHQFHFTLEKNRAAEDPTKVVDGWIEPVLELLAKITQRPRSTLQESLQDYVFVFGTTWGKKRRAKCFFRFTDNQQDAEAMNAYISEFCKRHQLPRFTLSQLRPTALNEVGVLHGSVAAFLTAWHKNFVTTDGSYLQSSAKLAEQEALGATQQRLQRFAKTLGKIDTRRSARTPSMDKDAATPGFTCADPFDSPRPCQAKGSLCDDYGGCPDCPHAAYDLSKPSAVALYVALRRALMASQDNLSPEAWLLRCQPQVAALDEMLQQVSSDVMKASALFKLRLPQIA